MISLDHQKKGKAVKIIKVKVYASYGFAETQMEFEETFTDDTTEEEIEETIKELVYQHVDWSYEKINI